MLELLPPINEIKKFNNFSMFEKTEITKINLEPNYKSDTGTIRSGSFYPENKVLRGKFEIRKLTVYVSRKNLCESTRRSLRFDREHEVLLLLIIPGSGT